MGLNDAGNGLSEDGYTSSQSSVCSPGVSKKRETGASYSKKITTNLARVFTEGHDSNTIIIIFYDEYVDSYFAKEAILKRTFYSKAHAEEFYKAYVKAKGFSEYKKVGVYDGDTLEKRTWICGQLTSMNSVECGAKFVIERNFFFKKYEVVEFVEEHNHKLHCTSSYIGSSAST